MSHTARNSELEKHSCAIAIRTEPRHATREATGRGCCIGPGWPEDDRMTLLHGRVEHGSILSIEDASKDPNGAEPRGGCRMRQVGIV
jgi:hypothetical protein